MTTKVDLNDDLVLEEILASYDSEYCIHSFFRDMSSNRKLTIPRLRSKENGCEWIALPFEEHNSIGIMPFFKQDDVPSNYECRLVPILYSSIVHGIPSLAVDGMTIIMFDPDTRDSTSIAGVAMYIRDDFTGYEKDPTIKHYGCFMIPHYVSEYSEDQVFEFLSNHYDGLSQPEPTFYQLPSRVYMEASVNHSTTH